MSTSLDTLTIRELAEQGHGAGEIAAMMETSPEVVDMVLKPSTRADVSEDEVALCFDVLKSIVRDEEQSPFLRSSNAKFLINEAKGRNDLKVGQVASSVSVVVLNQRFEAAQEKKLRSLGLAPA